MYDSAEKGPSGGRPGRAKEEGPEKGVPEKTEVNPRMLSGFTPRGMKVDASKHFPTVPEEHLTWGVNDDAGTLAYGEKPPLEEGFVDLKIPAQPGSIEIRGGMHPPSKSIDASESSK